MFIILGGIFGLMAVGLAKDEPLLERLRILVSDPTTDSHVKKKAVELFGSWSVNFRNEVGMEQLAGLRSQMPTKVSIPSIRAEAMSRNALLQLYVLPPLRMNPPVLHDVDLHLLPRLLLHHDL